MASASRAAAAVLGHSVPTELVVSAGGVDRTVAVPDGASAAVDLNFPAVTGDALRVRISKVRQETTVDRRFGEVTELPVGVATIAIDGVAPLRVAPAVDTGCRDDLVRLDGSPLPVRFSGSTADLLAGKAATIVPCSTAPLELAKGTHHLTATPGARTGIDLDQLVLRSSALAQPTAAPPARRGAPGPPRRGATRRLGCPHSSQQCRAGIVSTGHKACNNGAQRHFRPPFRETFQGHAAYRTYRAGRAFASRAEPPPFVVLQAGNPPRS